MASRFKLKPKLIFFNTKKKKFSNENLKRFKLYFGDISLYTLSFLVFTLKFTLKLILKLKRFVKRKSKGFRKFWILPGNYVRIAFKSKGARMGKGKGKTIVFVRRIYPFRNFIEFRNIRYGRIWYFTRLLKSQISNSITTRLADSTKKTLHLAVK